MNKPVSKPGRPKPHIFKRAGFWRVSPMPRPYNYRIAPRWEKAHHFILPKNEECRRIVFQHPHPGLKP